MKKNIFLTILLLQVVPAFSADNNLTPQRFITLTAVLATVPTATVQHNVNPGNSDRLTIYQPRENNHDQNALVAKYKGQKSAQAGFNKITGKSLRASLPKHQQLPSSGNLSHSNRLRLFHYCS